MRWSVRSDRDRMGAPECPPVVTAAERATAGPAAAATFGYVPALDGVRAFAVLAVLAFHGGLPGASGGFLGVDAFFVLSGYLITALLLAERQRTGRIALASFWGRRARRLLPALLLVLVTVTLTAPLFLPGPEVRLLRGEGLAALFYVANWALLFRDQDYFTQTAAPSPLGHTWSLGIEEQFYLLWPLVLILVLATRGAHRLLLTLCLSGAAASTLAVAFLYQAADPSRAYYGTDTRATGLLLGASLATWLATRTRRGVATRHRVLRSVPVLVACAGLAWLWTHASGESLLLYRGGLAVHALCVVVVLAHVAMIPAGLPARLLSLTPLLNLGRISYGVYLWHWPVFVAADAEHTGLDGWNLFGLRCALTLALATLSYRLVERPLRTGVRPRRPFAALSLATGAVAACAGLVVTATVVPASPQEITVAPQRDGLDELAGSTASEVADTPRPRRDHEQLPRRVRRPGQPVVVDIFGDSVAWSLAAYLPSHPDLHIRDRTSLGCGITTTAPYRYFGQTYPTVMPKCQSWPRRWHRAIVADNPDIAVVLVGRWETMDRVLGGRWMHLGDAAYDAHLRSQLDQAIRIVGSRGGKVLLATEPYNRRGERPDGRLHPEDQPSRVTKWNQLLRNVAAAHPGVDILDFGARVSPDGHYSDTAGGFRIRADGLHLAPEGVQRWIATWLFTQLLKAARP